MSVIKFASIRNPENKIPTRANKYDAGIDFYVPKFDEQFLIDFAQKNPEIYFVSDSIFNKDTNEYEVVWCMKLKPHQRVLIPSGFKCLMEFPDRALIASNKGGVSNKKGLIFTAQVVDFEYTGEIHIGLVNTSNDIVEIYEDEKIIQFIETPIYVSEIIMVNEEEINERKTTRGEGGFGSTNSK
jgi:dUTPase